MAKLIDIKGLQEGTIEMKSLTYDSLMEDAEARGDEEAVIFLMNAQAEIITRKRKNGKEYDIQRPISEIRAEYLRKFAGYETKTQIKSAAKSKANRDERIKNNKAKAQEVLERIKKSKEKTA